jgi:hypothetical protein
MKLENSKANVPRENKEKEMIGSKKSKKKLQGLSKRIKL